jgi:universal stress protein A
MKQLTKILVPTDLSENSRRALSYGCWLAAEDKAALVILHVANDLNAWEFYTEEVALVELNNKIWPADRVLAEASLELSRFLEPSLQNFTKVRSATRRVVLGSVAQQIIAVAEEESADLVIMSPRRHRGLRHLFYGAVSDQVMRLSPCPVLSITPPLPSKSWRGKVAPTFFGWPRQRAATI